MRVFINAGAACWFKMRVLLLNCRGSACVTGKSYQRQGHRWSNPLYLMAVTHRGLAWVGNTLASRQ
jgi:hypothetical protein